MANSLDADTCIYVEAVTNDGGNHTAAVWWLSPDIDITAPIAGKANPGVKNTVQCRVHKKSGCTVSGTDTVIVQAYVADPNVAFSPSLNSNKIGETVLTASVLTPPGTTKTLDWTPTGTGVQSPGHKCLVLRSFPDNLTPSSANFFLPQDRHAAQHNLCIIPCPNPGPETDEGDEIPEERQGEMQDGKCTFDVGTANLAEAGAEQVTIRAERDLAPSSLVLQAARRHLERMPDFRRLDRSPPLGFRMAFPPEVPVQEVRERTENPWRNPPLLWLYRLLNWLFGLFGRVFWPGPAPAYEATVELPQGYAGTFGFAVDLSNMAHGDAQIYHLRQIGANGRDQGGLTLVYVKVH